MTAPAYNGTVFRQQFPQFADAAKYPDAALSFAWSMGANWFNQTQASWGVGSYTPSKLQMAADLMGAILAYQLYGPGQQTGGEQNQSQQGQAPGPLNAAAEGTVSASFTIPAMGSSAFAALCYSSPPYGRMLLALLQISASVGPYIGSCRPSWVPP